MIAEQSARPRGFEPLTYGSGGRSRPLAVRVSASQPGGIVHTSTPAGFQNSHPFAPSSTPFAAPVLQGRPALTVVPSVPERLLTVREVAERLGVCTATVYSLCRDGKLEHVRIANAIRITPSALAALIAGRKP